MSLEAALDRISRERAAALTLELLQLPSPTGDTVRVTERFAAELEELGLAVEWYRRFPQTPVVAGRLRGAAGGQTLILNGHLDTVPVPHAPPERRDGRVYGRGAIDMKGPLAAAVEALRAIRESGLQLAGDVVLCAHGLHEAPGGRGEDLAAALRDGFIRGDAALVLELAHDGLPVVQLGMGIFRARFHRRGGVTHELRTPPGVPHPAAAAAEAVRSLMALNARLSESPLAYTGPESVFLGQVHCGDFYNRFPAEAWLEGTRRYAPEKTAEEVGAELQRLLEEAGRLHGMELEFSFSKVRDGCRVDPDHPLVSTLRAAYEAETKRTLPLTGSRTVADASLFEKEGGIPCLYHGLEGEGAHGDVESVPERELERGARVYLRTLVNYLGIAPA